MKKQIIITAIITAIICITGTSYAAYKLKAEQVSFDKTNTDLNSIDVQSAIDELADMTKKTGSNPDRLILFGNDSNIKNLTMIDYKIELYDTEQNDKITFLKKVGGGGTMSIDSSGRIVLNRTGSGSPHVKSNLIDLTDYSILGVVFDVIPYNSGDARSATIYVNESSDTYNSVIQSPGLLGLPGINNGGGVAMLDISELSGEYSIGAFISVSGSITISKIWLQ